MSREKKLNGELDDVVFINGKIAFLSELEERVVNTIMHPKKGNGFINPSIHHVPIVTKTIENPAAAAKLENDLGDIVHKLNEHARKHKRLERKEMVNELLRKVRTGDWVSAQADIVVHLNNPELRMHKGKLKDSSRIVELLSMLSDALKHNPLPDPAIVSRRGFFAKKKSSAVSEKNQKRVITTPNKG